MNKIFSLLIIVALLIVHSSNADAKTYKWKDEKGKTHFTDNPLKIPEKYREKTGATGSSKNTRIRKKVLKPDSISDSKPQLEPQVLKKEQKVKIHNLEGAWRGWGGVVLERDFGRTYTGTYKDTYGTDVGSIRLEMILNFKGEYTGEWWEGEARIGELKFKVSDDGGAIRGTWCALDSSEIKPGEPSCAKPSSFSWTRAK
jgi:hypothetical protein